jgi:hypothetical protein
VARADGGPSFDDRVAAANLSPQQRETAAATLFLAGLVAELCGLIREQTDQITVQNGHLAEQNDLLDDIRNGRQGRRGAAAGGPTDEGKAGGGSVRVTEPELPPPDRDPGPDDKGDTDSGGSVAEPATSSPAAGSPPAKKATRAPSAAKKTTAAARRPRGGKG